MKNKKNCCRNKFSFYRFACKGRNCACGGKTEIDRNSPGAAFTFAETLAVLAVTVILTSQAGIAGHHLVQKARVSSAKNQIEQFKAALQSYYVDCGRFPTSEQGLDALFEKPELYPVNENWDGPYVDRRIGKDPWGFEYGYFHSKSAGFPPEAPDGLPFAIVCYGADGEEGGDGAEKDIWSWE